MLIFSMRIMETGPRRGPAPYAMTHGIKSMRPQQESTQVRQENPEGSLWRRGWDSNPRYPCRYAAFRVRCIRPLCHLSGCRSALEARAVHSGCRVGLQGGRMHLIAMVTEISLTVFIASPIAQGAVAWVLPVPRRRFFVSCRPALAGRATGPTKPAGRQCLSIRSD